MMRSALLVLVVGLAMIGCESKKEKCEKVAEHLDDIATKEGTTSSRSADYQMCMDSNDKQVDCLMKATSRQEIIACAK